MTAPYRWEVRPSRDTVTRANLWRGDLYIGCIEIEACIPFPSSHLAAICQVFATHEDEARRPTLRAVPGGHTGSGDACG